MRVPALLLSFAALARAQEATVALDDAPGDDQDEVLLDYALGAQDEEDRNETEGGIKVEFKGKGGKFYFKREGENQRTEVRLKRVRVMDGGTNQSCRQSNTQEFTAHINNTAKLPGKDGVDAHQVKFMADLDSWGKVAMDTYLSKGEGESGLDNEGAQSFSVKQGNLKFNIELYDFEDSAWDAGLGCDNATHVDVELEVNSATGKGKGGKGGKGGSGDGEGGKGGKGGKGRRQDDDIGDNFTLEFDAEYSRDGVLTLMPGDYPDYAEDGMKYTYTFRFDKFEDKVIYDPAIVETEAEGDENGCKKFIAFAALAFPLLSWLLA